jgi:uncharacterized protein (TIGR02679 family)
VNRVDARLHKLLGGDELAALRRRLRRHFEATAPGSLPGMLRLGTLDPAEREALALLTGRPPRDTKSLQIDIGLVDTKLRDAGIAGSLRQALEQIDGPIVYLASMRAAAQASWSAVVTACTHPGLIAYLQAPAALGLLKRLARQDTSAAEQLLKDADAVLLRLPAAGVARAQLAAETLGNAHALDTGQATATLVLAAWRQIEKSPSAINDADDPIDGTTNRSPDSSLNSALNTAHDSVRDTAPDEHTRDVWARAGVLVNELARPALVLNVPVHADDARVCVPGEPAYLSLRRLLRTPPRWAVAAQTVFVCENPNLIAIAADQLGAACAPLVCTDGMPAAAQRTLLTQLVQAGARLRYHGDFDWPGVQIANHVMRVWRAQPWRFAALDYEAAAALAPHTRRDLLNGCIVATWDSALAPAMQRHGLAIAEEAVAAILLEDLLQE